MNEERNDNKQGRHGHHRGHGHPRHRRDEYGFGPEFGFGPGGRGRGGPFGRGGRRRKRGDVRAAVIVLLSEEPRNGYQLMQEIEERSDGAWRPSPGSIYPALSQLEDEGLIEVDRSAEKKQFALTDEGRKHFEEHGERLGEPWADLSGDAKGAYGDLQKQIKPLMVAVTQVFQAGDEASVKSAAEVLAETRRKLYAILAEDQNSTN
jgi:DNA-binding PadR family transcriptional regulator